MSANGKIQFGLFRLRTVEFLVLLTLVDVRVAVGLVRINQNPFFNKRHLRGYRWLANCSF